MRADCLTQTCLTSVVTYTVMLCSIIGGRAEFIQPPPYTKNSYQDNPRYTLGSQVDFSWKADVSSTLELMLFIDYPRLPDHPDQPDSYNLASMATIDTQSKQHRKGLFFFFFFLLIPNFVLSAAQKIFTVTLRRSIGRLRSWAGRDSCPRARTPFAF